MFDNNSKFGMKFFITAIEINIKFLLSNNEPQKKVLILTLLCTHKDKYIAT